MRRFDWRYLSVAVVLPGVTLGAMSAVLAQGQRPQFEARTDVIRLDVSVLDKSRMPVTDLKVTDFSVRENGREAQIEAVTLVTLPSADSATTGPLSRVASDIVTNQLGRRERLTVILLDDSLTPRLPAFVNGAKAAARNVLAALGPEDAASVVFTEDNRLAHGFTTDRARLHAAIDAFQGGGFSVENLMTMRASEEARAIPTMATLRQLVEVLAAVPDRRKSVIYIGPGMPVELGETSTNPHSPLSQLNAMYRATTKLAREANVNVYTIDSSGLDGMRSQLERVATNAGMSAEMLAERRSMVNDLAGMFDRSLRTIAESTGGRAFTGLNTFDTQAPEIFREAASFYLVGYRSPHPARDGRFRRIEVRVNRPGVSVRSRSGYYAEPPVPPVLPSAPEATVRALASILPASEFMLSMTAAVLPDRASGGAGGLLVPVLRMPTLAGGGQWRVSFRAFTLNGHERGSQEFSVGTGTKVEGSADTFEVRGHISLPPGRYELRAGVVHALSGQRGSVHLQIEVPEFGSLLTMSTPVLGVEPSVPSSGSRTLVGLLPFAPVASRAFGTSDRVQLFVRIVGANGTTDGGRLTTTITSVSGQNVFDLTRQLRSDEFVTQEGVAHQLDIPVRTLPPAEYVLTLVATVGKDRVERAVRFEVR